MVKQSINDLCDDAVNRVINALSSAAENPENAKKALSKQYIQELKDEWEDYFLNLLNGEVEK